MNICLIGQTYPYRGGVSHHTTLLFRYLRKSNTVHFFSFKRQYPAILFPGKTDLDPSRVPVKETDVERSIDSMNPLTWISVAVKIIRLKPDVLILPWWVVFWAPMVVTIAAIVKLFSDTQILFVCHNVLEHESALWKKLLTKTVFLFGDRFVTHSAKETSRLNELISKKAPIATSFHPTYKDLSTAPLDSETARKQLGVTGPVLLFFGFVRAYKGLDILLNAMPTILNQQDVTLIVAGEFWQDKQRYLGIMDNLGIAKAVKIVDTYIPNEAIAVYFSAADLVVQPYRSVSGSGVCQLAYGLGRPVIATNIGSLAEVVKDRENGRIVDPEDPEAIASAVLESLVPETLKKYKKNAAYTARNFSWSKYIDDLLTPTRQEMIIDREEFS